MRTERRIAEAFVAGSVPSEVRSVLAEGVSAEELSRDLRGESSMTEISRGISENTLELSGGAKRPLGLLLT
jgi:hypothetical protein